MGDAATTNNLAEAHAKSYNYLRIGLVGAALLIAVSVAIEANAQDCLKGSISAYYHTPVRAMFVGGLIATGFGLIVLRGKPDTEDVFLNLAGMLAPIVAVVPASEDGLCGGIEPEGDARFTTEQITTIANNIDSLAWVGLVALAIGAFFGYRSLRGKEGTSRPSTATIAGLVVAAVLLVGSYLIYWLAEDLFLDNAHFAAAVAMFVMLGLASWVNGQDHDDIKRGRKVRNLYRGIALAMAGGGLAIYYVLFADDERRVLYLEIYELALFTIYWIAQTVENWSGDARAVLLAAPPASSATSASGR